MAVIGIFALCIFASSCPAPTPADRWLRVHLKTLTLFCDLQLADIDDKKVARDSPLRADRVTDLVLHLASPLFWQLELARHSIKPQAPTTVATAAQSITTATATATATFVKAQL